MSAGILRGALARLGIQAVVVPEVNLPQCTLDSSLQNEHALNLDLQVPFKSSYRRALESRTPLSCYVCSNESFIYDTVSFGRWLESTPCGISLQGLSICFLSKYRWTIPSRYIYPFSCSSLIDVHGRRVKHDLASLLDGQIIGGCPNIYRVETRLDRYFEREDQ